VTPAGEIIRRMRELPFADLDAIAPGKSLVLAPHPDDETLGCGAFVIEACNRGRAPLIVAVTDGGGSHPGSAAYPPERLKALRASELRSAAEILGVPEQNVRFLGLPDTCVPRDGPDFESAVQTVVTMIRDNSVANLLASWTHDPHGDHQATAWIACRAAQIGRVRLLFYPVWGWLLPRDQPLPITSVRGARLDVGQVREQKRRALAAHASQYSGLITDEPRGFQLPHDLLVFADQDYEVFLEA
jgi:LmbE family N-acetylglucosaminyl deacetylase